MASNTPGEEGNSNSEIEKQSDGGDIYHVDKILDKRRHKKVGTM